MYKNGQVALRRVEMGRGRRSEGSNGRGERMAKVGGGVGRNEETTIFSDETRRKYGGKLTVL